MLMLRISDELTSVNNLHENHSANCRVIYSIASATYRANALSRV